MFRSVVRKICQLFMETFLILLFMRTFVMGDIHGAYRALVQCLERSGFDRSVDTLIQLDDVADGFEEVYACVEELMRIPGLIAIKGNHDEWLKQFLETGYHPQGWNHGGAATARSYLKIIDKADKLKFTGKGYKTALNPADIPEHHGTFFRRQQLYHIDDDKVCYVHGGFNRHLAFRGQRPEIYYWDRDLWRDALTDAAGFRMVTRFKEIYIGHTSTMQWKTDQPMNAVNIYNLDTGAGHAGRLTIMDVATKRCWQSDPVRELYG